MGNIPEFGTVKVAAGFKALYAMSAKFAARLQAATASGKPVLRRVDRDAGHTGIGTTVRQVVDDFADVVSCALWRSGDPDCQPLMK